MCRTTDESALRMGAIEHIEVAGDEGPRTCLGGAKPEADAGPDAAGQGDDLDPDGIAGNGDELAFIPDGMTKSNEVVRAQWDEADGQYRFKDLLSLGGDGKPRPTVAATG